MMFATVNNTTLSPGALTVTHDRPPAPTFFLLMSYINNTVQLIGNLGSAPELRELRSGKTLATASLALNTRRKDERGNVTEDTQWVRLKGWDLQADRMMDRLQRGTRVLIQGRLGIRDYEANDGGTRRAVEITLSSFEVLERYVPADSSLLSDASETAALDRATVGTEAEVSH